MSPQCHHSPVLLIRHVLSQHFLCTHHRWCDVAFAAGTSRNAPAVCRAAAACHNKAARLGTRDSVLYNPFSCLLVKVSTTAFPSSFLFWTLCPSESGYDKPQVPQHALAKPTVTLVLATAGPLSGLPAQVE